MAKNDPLQFFTYGSGTIPYWGCNAGAWYNESWYTPVQVAPLTTFTTISSSNDGNQSKDVIELKVHFCCQEGCVPRMELALNNVEGVGAVYCDYTKGKVTVSGSATEDKVLKAARAVDPRARIWDKKEKK